MIKMTPNKVTKYYDNDSESYDNDSLETDILETEIEATRTERDKKILSKETEKAKATILYDLYRKMEVELVELKGDLLATQSIVIKQQKIIQILKAKLKKEKLKV